MTRVFTHVRVVAGAACAALALLPSAIDARHPDSFPSTQANRKYNVAVVRADGAITPFGQFDRGTWRPLWTGVERSSNITVPLTLEDVDRSWWRREPPSLDWTLWRGQAEPLALRVTAPRMVAAPCGAQVALATDFRPAGSLPPPEEAPYPKLGLATTAPADIEAIADVERDSAGWQRARHALDGRVFRAAETRALHGMQWAHPVPPLLRERATVDLQALWHVPGSRFYYFEAMRRYPDPDAPRGKPACDLVTYVAGYLWADPLEHLQPVDVGAVITYCHMERAMFLWPLGVIRDSGKQYWLFQSAGWTGEVYGVAEPVPDRGIVRTHLWHVAGRCR
jgi:hypothetical protein